MRDPEEIKRFTRNFGSLSDPPFLPVALFAAIAPLAGHYGYLGWYGWNGGFALALVASLVATRLYRRRYGYVVPENPKTLQSFIAAVIAAVLLQAISVMAGLRLHLAALPWGLWLAYGALASEGYRLHLLAPALVFFAAVFLPLMTGDAKLESLLFQTAFGFAWTIVCLGDFVVVRRNLVPPLKTFDVR